MLSRITLTGPWPDIEDHTPQGELMLFGQADDISQLTLRHRFVRFTRLKLDVQDNLGSRGRRNLKNLVGPQHRNGRWQFAGTRADRLHLCLEQPLREVMGASHDQLFEQEVRFCHRGPSFN